MKFKCIYAATGVQLKNVNAPFHPHLLPDNVMQCVMRKTMI